jgi:hypothetical protein
MRLPLRPLLIAAILFVIPCSLNAQPPSWGNYNGNPQHTGVSTTPLQDLSVIKWSTPVDLQPNYSGNDLLIHYGSPLATANNTIVVPVKTGLTDGFQVEGRRGFDGSVKWVQSTDYTLPPHDWTPSYAPAITPQNRLYYAGEGGTIFYRDNLDANGNVANPNRVAFYGLDNYTANTAGARGNVFINTPITPDAHGNIYFGFQVTNSVTLGNVTLNSGGGIARIDPNGNATYVQASTAAGDANIRKVVHNAAPAISNDGNTVYVAVTDRTGTGFGSGYLLALNSSNLATTGSVALKDVNTPANNARLPEAGSASPMVAPNGDVFFGVLENTTQFRSRGWMLHFDSSLSQTLIPSRFGWDNTASIIDPALVPSYTGSAPYLILTKYNNYAGLGGDGHNRIGIFDPFNTEADPIYGQPVAKEVLSVLGPTPDPEFPNVPGAVREWCINSAAVDPFRHRVLVNSEDGKSYVWDLDTNTLIDTITLTPGIGEAYTPTMIGPDGTGYAINNGTLFALAFIGVPEPSTILLSVGGGAGLIGLLYGKRRRRRRQAEQAIDPEPIN